ncbi:MAG: TIGR02391 family protein [Gallionella sp.]|nr:TIGR02391 family protein [Gallionella sp.]
MAINLRAEIRNDLWGAIAKPYESQVYSGAILEAIHLLSGILRERANIDGDGISLVSQALSGDSPRLRINKFQTETEKNEQRGLEQILRGVYQGIRNPRSHEQFEDAKETADAIILFINHIVGVISEAKEPFTIDEWSNRVFDENFVASDRYAKLLASEVPSKKYNEALIAIFRNKASGDGDKLNYIFRALIELAGDDKIDDFLAVVSDDLRTQNFDLEIRLTLQVLPERLWPRLSEVARLRTENKLIQSIEKGRYELRTQNCESGALGTWARDFFKYFSLKPELFNVLAKKLSGDDEEQNYVAEFFFWNLPDSIEADASNAIYSSSDYRTKHYIRLIVQGVSSPDASTILREKFLNRFGFSEKWQKLILEEIESVKDSDPEFFNKFINIDDIPF